MVGRFEGVDTVACWSAETMVPRVLEVREAVEVGILMAEEVEMGEAVGLVAMS